MQNSFDKYTAKLKSRLDKNFLSPLFIRYANLLYANEHYEECIAVCRTGLEIYPRYTTAKLILLKAFLKTEYLNEAEILFKELKPKLTNRELAEKLESNIQNLKAISGQEKIYYSKTPRIKFDFRTFEKNFHMQENLFSDYTDKDIFDDKAIEKIKNDKNFLSFASMFGDYHFDSGTERKPVTQKDTARQILSQDSGDEILSKIRIVTETLADIYAEQGNYKEAFDAYNLLIRAGSVNSKRIEDKINELERNMLKHD